MTGCANSERRATISCDCRRASRTEFEAMRHPGATPWQRKPRLPLPWSPSASVSRAVLGGAAYGDRGRFGVLREDHSSGSLWRFSLCGIGACQAKAEVEDDSIASIMPPWRLAGGARPNRSADETHRSAPTAGTSAARSTYSLSCEVSWEGRRSLRSFVAPELPHSYNRARLRLDDRIGRQFRQHDDLRESWSPLSLVTGRLGTETRIALSGCC